jgi:glycosyltransferase involved in cell wall biosynthesis
LKEFELVVPAYNEAKNLPLLIERAVTAAQAAALGSDQFCLVVVNNGSQDQSRETLENLQKGPLGKWFRVTNIEINQGYGHGLWRGLTATHAKYVGWTHADLQCDPKHAFEALKILTQKSGNLLVKGARIGRSRKDIAVSRVFELFARLILGFAIFEINAQPKVFERSLLSKIKSPPDGFGFDLYVLYSAKKNGYSFETIPVSFPSRIHGVSNWASNFVGRYRTILGMIKFMIDLAKSEGRM